LTRLTFLSTFLVNQFHWHLITGNTKEHCCITSALLVSAECEDG